MRVGLWCAVVGVALAVTAVFVVNGEVGSGALGDAHLSIVLAYAATWIPMLAAVAAFAVLAPAAGVVNILGIRFRWIDLLWGGAIGIFARSVASIISLAIYGATGLSGQPLIGGIDGWFVFAALLAPVVIAPVIEELFFRGLLQGAIERRVGSSLSRGLTIAVAVGATSVVFMVVHLIGVTSPSDMIVLGVPLVLFAVGAGIARAYTGRIGAAVVAHVVFNGVAAVLMWPW